MSNVDPTNSNKTDIATLAHQDRLSTHNEQDALHRLIIIHSRPHNSKPINSPHTTIISSRLQLLPRIPKPSSLYAVLMKERSSETGHGFVIDAQHSQLQVIMECNAMPRHVAMTRESLMMELAIHATQVPLHQLTKGAVLRLKIRRQTLATHASEINGKTQRTACATTA